MKFGKIQRAAGGFDDAQITKGLRMVDILDPGIGQTQTAVGKRDGVLLREHGRIGEPGIIGTLDLKIAARIGLIGCRLD